MLLVVDGNNMAYRALHAMSLTSPDGYDVSIIYGTLRMLSTLMNKFHPSAILVAYDNGIPAYRRELLPEYKMHRIKDSRMDWDGVYAQIDELNYTALPILGIATTSQYCVEADDLMYWASRLSVEDDVVIVTTDADMNQAICDSVSVWNTYHEIMHTCDNFDEYPLEWHLVYKALCGDSSDGIPGVKGIGPKSALAVIDAMRTYGRPICEICDWNWKNLNHRQNDMLKSVGWAVLHNWIQVMDLEYPSGARYALTKDVRWHSYSKELARRYIRSYSMTSLMYEVYVFAKLREPEFHIPDRVPVVMPKTYDMEI